MKRREPRVDPVSDVPPAWLFAPPRPDPRSWGQWVAPEEPLVDEFDRGWPWEFRAWCEARRRWRTAAEQWCSERGLSFCMTVLSWNRPAPSEIAAGHTKSLPRPPIQRRDTPAESAPTTFPPIESRKP